MCEHSASVSELISVNKFEYLFLSKYMQNLTNCPVQLRPSAREQLIPELRYKMNKKNIISENKKCFYFDNGFCKYFKSCKFIHPTENCKNTECLQSSCEMRHTKACPYFQSEYGCKFKENCLFKHSENYGDCDICENFKGIIEKDRVMLEELLKTIRVKDAKIENLQAQNDELKNATINLKNEKQLMNNVEKVKNVEIVKLTAKIVELNSNLRFKDNEINQKSKQLNVFTTQIEALKKTQVDNENLIDQLKSNNEHSNAAIADKESQITTLIRDKEALNYLFNTQCKQAGFVNVEKDSPKISTFVEDASQKVQSNENYVNDEEVFQCGFCRSKFFMEADLTKHMRTKHARITKEILINCDFCDQWFFLESDVHRHIKVIHEDIAKDVLGKAFWLCDDQAAYAFECGNCDFNTSSEKCLNLHIEDCQGLNYKCDKCNFKCKTAGLLKRHKSQKH